MSAGVDMKSPLIALSLSIFGVNAVHRVESVLEVLGVRAVMEEFPLEACPSLAGVSVRVTKVEQIQEFLKARAGSASAGVPNGVDHVAKQVAEHLACWSHGQPRIRAIER